ncbi:hypothetical protein COB52_04985 [Candidatus Kaiserbacteria bacterium]|nr:MAG: hypothetical protein COB52_04985 [Candidatus Kaiserbacteria bacterium]
MTGLIMKYFVLKPRGQDIYAKASRAAVRAYAKVIEEENPEFSHGLLQWNTQEMQAKPKEADK